MRAVLTGGILAVSGTIPLALLVSANTRHWSSVPSAVPPALLYLWFYWRYVRGEGWPRSTEDSRRTNCRANPLSGDAWGAALLAGILGLVSILLLQGVMGRLVTLPQQERLDTSQ